MSPTTFSAAELDRAKRDLLVWLLGLPAETSLEAAQQRLRTAVDPRAYQAVGRVSQQVAAGGPRLTRLVAEWLGYNQLAEFFPMVAPVIWAYQEGSGEPAQMAQAFREIAAVAALYNEELFNKYYAALLAAQTSDRLHRWAQSVDRFPAEQFWQELAQLKGSATPAYLPDEAVVWETPLQPVHATVVASDSDRSDHFRLGATIRVIDPVLDRFQVEFTPPQLVERHNIEAPLTIPMQAAADGIQLELAVTDGFGREHLPERFFLNQNHLQQLRQRGSAVPVRLGRNEEIRFYPEYLMTLPGEQAELPEEALASLRVRQNAIIVQPLHPNTRLTVFL